MQKYNLLNNKIKKIIRYENINDEDLDKKIDRVAKPLKYSPFIKAPIPDTTERHLPGYNFCGPGTQVKERLERQDYGVNDLDNACRVHDVEYMILLGDAEALQESDKKLADIAEEISKTIDAELESERPVVISFLNVWGLPLIYDSVTNNSKLKEKVFANSVEAVFKGKKIAEDVGLIDPKKFSESLSNNKTKKETIKEGINLYKKYILN